jgi:hypothetical protein
MITTAFTVLVGLPAMEIFISRHRKNNSRDEEAS